MSGTRARDARKPVVLIAGGRGMARPKGPDPLLQASLRLSPASEPSVAYVGAASGDNAVFRTMITHMLKKAGAGEVRLAPLCGKRADVSKAERVLREADVVFVSGGDVEEGMKVLGETGTAELIRSLHAAGKPLFGVSAGSIMLARHWVRWTDPDDDGTAEIFPCLGCAPLCCDTHGEGEGWEELQALQKLLPDGSVSYGIASGSALLAMPDGTVEALGGAVHRFRRRDGKVVRIEDLTPQPWRA